MRTGCETCKNCGADYALHHYKTQQCPAHGREAPIGKKQEWMSSTFQEKDEAQIRLEKAAPALLEACKAVRFDILDKPTCYVRIETLKKIQAAIKLAEGE